MAKSSEYTPGYSANVVQFMARRSAETHAHFFMPMLRPGFALLDCGCGPGSITSGLARVVAPGEVVGVDADPRQVETARRHNEGITNLRFEVAEGQTLPFPGESFDAVFAHAVLEHVADPVATVGEFFRVLRPGGVVGVRSPDWGGFVLAPQDPDVDEALAAYQRLQHANGGDTLVGRKLGQALASVGFLDVVMDAEYECYADREVIGEFLALRLEATDLEKSKVDALRRWSRLPGGLFAQTWISAVGRKPAGSSSSESE